MGLESQNDIFTRDQDDAITTLIEKLKREVAQGIEERSRKYASKTNAVGERGVQSVEDQVRVLKLELEDRLGVRIPVSHPIMTWMVPHAADLLNKMEVGHDGRTAYERFKRKKYHGEIAAFGSKVLFRPPRKKLRGGNLNPRW